VANCEKLFFGIEIFIGFGGVRGDGFSLSFLEILDNLDECAD